MRSSKTTFVTGGNVITGPRGILTRIGNRFDQIFPIAATIIGLVGTALWVASQVR